MLIITWVVFEYGTDLMQHRKCVRVRVELLASSSRVTLELEWSYTRAQVKVLASSSVIPRNWFISNIYCSCVKCHKLSLVPANPIHWIRHKVNVIHALVLKRSKACTVVLLTLKGVAHCIVTHKEQTCWQWRLLVAKFYIYFEAYNKTRWND